MRTETIIDAVLGKYAMMYLETQMSSHTEERIYDDDNKPARPRLQSSQYRR